MANYNKSFIYKLCCNDPDIKDIYIGSTINFRSRKCSHKRNCTEPKQRQYSYKVYEYIRANGGWDNWDMLLIEEVNCNSKLELHTKEKEYIKQYNTTLNTHIPTRTKPEYNRDNFEKQREKVKEWRQKNPEHHANITKKYATKNATLIAQWRKNYTERKRLKKLCFNIWKLIII